jgi:hypothetical protein
MTDAQVLERLETALDGAECHGPIDSTTIEQAETVLGVSFPRSYRLVIAAFGACFGGRVPEISGLTAHDFSGSAPDGPPQWSSVVRNTLSARTASRGTLPSSYISISGDGIDCRFFLDSSQEATDGECPVIALGPGRHNEVQASSFLAFVARPNHSFNRTRYGKRRKPGLRHMVHHLSPGLRRLPPWAG